MNGGISGNLFALCLPSSPSARGQSRGASAAGPVPPACRAASRPARNRRGDVHILLVRTLAALLTLNPFNADMFTRLNDRHNCELTRVIRQRHQPGWRISCEWERRGRDNGRCKVGSHEETFCRDMSWRRISCAVHTKGHVVGIGFLKCSLGGTLSPRHVPATCPLV